MGGREERREENSLLKVPRTLVWLLTFKREKIPKRKETKSYKKIAHHSSSGTEQVEVIRLALKQKK